jgi:hypothetical protein
VRVIEFWQFCEKVLQLKLTPGQRVVAKVAFGDYDPCDLEGLERDLALQMFGGLERVPASAKRFVCLRLGRGSGKTTLCSAYAVYVAVCQQVKVGPGDTPYVITIAPDKETAKLSISMAREMIRGQPALERLVVGDEKQAITIRRPDGLQVKIESFAASRGGYSIRGRTILAFLLDEAEFFTSNVNQESNFAVNDQEIFRALKPRLVRGGKGMLVSTPWPVETLMGVMFDRNWGKPDDAVAVKAPTSLVRGDDHDVLANVEEERLKDPENARREYDCELDAISGEGFFDLHALQTSVGEFEYPGKHNPLFPTAAACDLGFKNDSSTLAVVQYDGRKYNLVYLAEKRPKPGHPLKPSEVLREFAAVAKRYGCHYIISDGHYREAVKEYLAENQLTLVDAPEGMKGKQETFSRVRSVLHEGLVSLPETELVRRMMAQAKLVSAKAAPGGGLSIKIPRKVGLGHGDLVSAWVLAVHRLAYSRVKQEKVVYEPGTPEWTAEFNRRLAKKYDEQNLRALKQAEKEVRSRMSGRRYRQLFQERNQYLG